MLSLCCFTATAIPAQENSRDKSDSARLDSVLERLRKNGIATDTDSILNFLTSLQRDSTQQKMIDRLIRQLSSDLYEERTAATKKLVILGHSARARLIEAARSKDLEVALRASFILKQLKSGDGRRRQRSLVFAALQVLKSRREAKAVPVLLKTIPVLDDPLLTDASCEAIWASTRATHAELLRKALSNESHRVRSAAIVALEIALGRNAVATLTPYWKSPSATLRLASARALIDRRPRESVAVLVELVADDSHEISWQSDALLQMVSGKPIEFSAATSLAKAWKNWSVRELPTATLKLPLGPKRLDLGVGRRSLHETFSRPASSLAKGYGVFRYVADNGGRARVVDGRLLIDGANNEGDQRVYVTADRMIGRAEWPRRVAVRARLGAKNGNNFGFHVGLSVGRVKVLFHPGLSGGSFRAESTDTHAALFSNQNMKFTPAAGTMHEMQVDVTKGDAGAEFRVTVRDGGSKLTYQHTFNVSDKQLGKFNRIALERSGQRGGDAVFERVSIELKP